MMCVSLAGKEFLGAIDTLDHMNNAVYIADVIKRYLMRLGPRMLSKFARIMPT